jgi:hypothetical protein
LLGCHECLVVSKANIGFAYHVSNCSSLWLVILS